MIDIIARLRSGIFAIEPNYAEALLQGLEKIKQSKSDGITHKAIANSSVTYQTAGNVAIIGIDGVMYKKEIGGMCSSVVSYEQIVSKINIAEEDDTIDTIMFRVDTNGGDVAGADEVRNKIRHSAKKTVLYAENLLASAGLWIFSAVDEIYSNDVTQIGSIGVLVIWQTSKDDRKINTIVSSSAKNKVCDIDEKNCQTKIKKRIDIYESKFLSRLEDSFSKTKEEIVADFNEGDTIFANEAQSKGYIKELLEFESLLQSLVVMPPHGKIAKSKLGAEMPKDTTEQNVASPEIPEQVAVAVAAEQTRISEVMDVLVKANKSDDEVLQKMAFDGKSTKTDVQAALYMQSQQQSLKVKKDIEKDGKEIAESLAHISSADDSEEHYDENVELSKRVAQAKKYAEEKQR